MRLIDANIVLRYALNDHAELSQKAKDIIDNNDVEIPLEAFSEVVFVLQSVYGLERKVICGSLTSFFEKTRCGLPHREAALKGLEYYGTTKLDFVDCMLAGYAETEHAKVETFDRDLQNFLARIG
jgi:predicted nucleic-acid-binding protein